MKSKLPQNFFNRYKDYELKCKVRPSSRGFKFKKPTTNDPLEPFVFHDWPESCLEIPLEGVIKGIGKGEERIAFILNGVVTGDDVSYDISVLEKKYEVKFVKNYSACFMAGIMGMLAMQNIRNKISPVIEKIASTSDIRILSCFDECEKEFLNHFKTISQSLLSGFLKYHTVSDLELAMVMIRDVKKRLNISQNCRTFPFYWDGETNISSRKHIGISRILNVHFDHTSCELFDEAFSDKDFEDYENFIKFVAKGPTPTDVFPEVDGLFLASECGYVYIPKEFLNDCLSFAWTGQGCRPNFRINKSAF